MSKPAVLPWKRAWSMSVPWRTEGRLHRISEVHRSRALESGLDPNDEFEALIHIDARTCCGLVSEFHLPGFSSRMFRQRCTTCAAIAEVDPDLPGIPGNGDQSGPRDAWQRDFVLPAED